MTMVEGLGWVLLHFVWQGAIVALALALLLSLTTVAQARLRYALSCGALTLMLVAALATAATVTSGEASLAGPEGLAAGSGARHAPAGLPEPRDSRSGRGANGSAAALPAPQRDDAATMADLARQVAQTAMPWIVLAWVAGVLLLSVRLLGGWWSIHRLGVAGVSPVPEWCRAQLTALAAQLRVSRPVAIVASVRVSVPVIIGHLKPVVVPAAALSGLSPTQLEAILAHELAHVRRHDYVVNLIQSVIETLLFYHPAVWWVSRQVREAREHCCDDLAVAVCRSRQEYVHALIDLEELRGNALVLALGATDGSLLARGRRLLLPPESQASSSRLAASVIALTVITGAAAGAAFHSASVPELALSPALDEASTERGQSRPAAGQAATAGQRTPVVTAPDPAASLASRWAWAEQEARRAGRRSYWVGYSVPPAAGLPPVLYHDRARMVVSGDMSFSGQLMSDSATDMRFPGRSLALTGQNHAVKVLLAFETGGGEPALAEVHTSTLALPVDTRDWPVLWLGPVDAAESLDRIDRLYGSVSRTELKHSLVAAAGVHGASARVVAWLERRIASRDPDEVRGDAAEWIARHPIAASIGALDRTARTDRSSHVRQEAAEALGDLALPEAAPVLIALARTLPDHDARLEAVEALGARPEVAAQEALVALAREDRDRDIQREAVETLGDFEDKRGVPVLLELARTHADVEIRREAIETLGDAASTDTVLALIEPFVNDRDPGIQEQAVETIAGLEDSGSLQVLIGLARSHANTGVRREAIDELAHRDGQSGADGAAIVEVLSSLAKSDPDIELQIEAVEALGDMGSTQSVAELRQLAGTHADERIRSEAVESLGETDAPAAETADFLKRVALADKSTDVQTEAFEALLELRDGAGIAALIDLAREHPSADARKEALERLLESDHPKAKEFFMRALRK